MDELKTKTHTFPYRPVGPQIWPLPTSPASFPTSPCSSQTSLCSIPLKKKKKKIKKTQKSSLFPLQYLCFYQGPSSWTALPAEIFEWLAPSHASGGREEVSSCLVFPDLPELKQPSPYLVSLSHFIVFSALITIWNYFVYLFTCLLSATSPINWKLHETRDLVCSVHYYRRIPGT